MLIARVVGAAISTIKDRRVENTKLLVLKQADHTGQVIGKPFVAIDLVDAGEGELVLTGHGSSARQTYLTKDCPVDAVVVAVIDHLEVDGEVVFRKE
ncbi:MAG: EutN/CcmL family microcompartment protein [Anaerolineales bacterium]|nr:EutN/CcmL family microcompartment protein [Anaerolineales bacterium]